MVSLTYAGRGRENKPGLHFHMTLFTTQYTHSKLYISQVEVERINLVCIFTWLYSLLNTLTPNYIYPSHELWWKRRNSLFNFVLSINRLHKATIKGTYPSKVRGNGMDDTNFSRAFSILDLLRLECTREGSFTFLKKRTDCFLKKPETKLSFLVF